MPVENKYDTSLADAAFALADRWVQAAKSGKLTQFSRGDLEGFTSGQSVVFLERLAAKGTFDAAAIEAVEKAYGFDGTQNTEIRLRWYIFALPTAPRFAKSAAQWVSVLGRMKFCRPTFRLLHGARMPKRTRLIRAAVDPAFAQSTYAQHKAFYHPLARGLIEKDIGLTARSSA